MQVIKRLELGTVLMPFYVAISNDQRFNALYSNTFAGWIDLVSSAITLSLNKHLYGHSDSTSHWAQLTSESPMTNNLTQNV